MGEKLRTIVLVPVIGDGIAMLLQWVMAEITLLGNAGGYYPITSFMVSRRTIKILSTKTVAGQSLPDE